MSELEQHRFDMLVDRFIDVQYIADYYGIEGFAQNANLVADLERFRSTMRNPPPVPDGMVDRYAVEGFLQARRLLPVKWAAARVGMTSALLGEILDRRLDLPTPIRQDYLEYGCLMPEGLSEVLIGALPALRFRTFYDHETFCEHLHNAIRLALNMPQAQFDQGKLWCATDSMLAAAGDGDYPRRYGYHFDCLTCEPLSAAHAIWLDFKKPLSLSPDRCSKLQFVRYRDELEDWVAGTRIPDDLERYEAVAEGVN